MRMRVLTTKLRVEIENEMRVFLESLNFEIEMRVSQKSAGPDKLNCLLMQDKMHIGHCTRQELIDFQIGLGPEPLPCFKN